MYVNRLLNVMIADNRAYTVFCLLLFCLVISTFMSFQRNLAPTTAPVGFQNADPAKSCRGLDLEKSYPVQP